MDVGFVRGQSDDNLPKIDSYMVGCFFSKNSDFMGVEVRGVKVGSSRAPVILTELYIFGVVIMIMIILIALFIAPLLDTGDMIWEAIVIHIVYCFILILKKKMAKDKEKSESKMEEAFIPPDGGWGWIIVFAAGFSNLCTFPVLQQFGLLFRDKFNRLAINNSQTSTIININSASTACVGLLNGPMFRKFTYRQISFVGASVVFMSLICTSFSNSFPTYLLSFSIMYGASMGITMSANALALNTYFREKRRIAAGLSWTTTGLGPIFWPLIIATVTDLFGELGAVLIMAGISFHAVAFALLLQPVEWHVNKDNIYKNEEEEHLNVGDKEQESGYFSKSSKFRNVSAFSSQYIYKEDDPVNTGYEIIDPGMPMLSKGNDGYFTTSKRSLNRLTSMDNSLKNSQINLSFSKKPSFSNLNENRSRKSSTTQLSDSKKNSSANLGAIAQDVYKGKRKVSVSEQIPESEIEDCPTLKAPQDLKAEEKVVIQNYDPHKAKIIEEKAKKHFANTKNIHNLKLDEDHKEKRYIRNNRSNMSLKTPEEYSEERKYFGDNHSNQSLKTTNRRKSNNFNYENEILKQASLKLEQYILKEAENKDISKIGNISEESLLSDDVFDSKEKEERTQLSFCQKVALFFDLDLLKDLTYVNLMIGITIANFNELNFSILTPFILGDYDMSKTQVAMFMSLLAGMDISVRFCIPFIAGKIGWENKSFFLFGVICMAMGRIVLAHCQLFSVTLLVAVMIGFGKGLRTVFMALVIPTHVPLHKLPAASGLQLLTSGIVFLTVGPLVGWIKDNSNNMVTLHCLNIFTYVTAIAWGYEKYRTTKMQEK